MKSASNRTCYVGTIARSAVSAAELTAAGRLDMSEVLLDATFTEARKGRACVCPTRCGVSVTVELATDTRGTPIGVATNAARVPDTMLGSFALACIPSGEAAPPMVPVIADLGIRSGPCGQLADRGFRLLSQHRRGRNHPQTNNGQQMRRYVVERTFS